VQAGGRAQARSRGLVDWRAQIRTAVPPTWPGALLDLRFVARSHQAAPQQRPGAPADLASAVVRRAGADETTAPRARRCRGSGEVFEFANPHAAEGGDLIPGGGRTRAVSGSPGGELTGRGRPRFLVVDYLRAPSMGPHDQRHRQPAVCWLRRATPEQWGTGCAEGRKGLIPRGVQTRVIRYESPYSLLRPGGHDGDTEVGRLSRWRPGAGP